MEELEADGLYHVVIGFDPGQNAAGWIGQLPDGSRPKSRWIGVTTIVLLEFFARVRGASRPMSRRPVVVLSGVRHPNDQRVVEWAEREGSAWAKRHAWKHEQRRLNEADIVINYKLLDLTPYLRPPAPEVFAAPDLFE